MNWLNELKVAYLNKDDDKINTLLDNLPAFKTRDEMLEALAIMEQITEYANTQKEKLNVEMRKLKQMKNFVPKDIKASTLNLSF